MARSRNDVINKLTMTERLQRVEAYTLDQGIADMDISRICAAKPKEEFGPVECVLCQETGHYCGICPARFVDTHLNRKEDKDCVCGIVPDKMLEITNEKMSIDSTWIADAFEKKLAETWQYFSSHFQEWKQWAVNRLWRDMNDEEREQNLHIFIRYGVDIERG